MLSQDERELLQSYVDRSQPGTAYRRRVQIILLADDGLTPEVISAQLNIPVARVRQFVRVFNRERLNLFPSSLISPPRPYSSDEPIAEAARMVVATLVEKALSHEDDLSTEADVFSVHETRKTCRRLRTAFRLFEPYYESGLLNGYRKRLRKVMRRLGRSRDTAVFRIKLEQYLTESPESESASEIEQLSFTAFAEYWKEAQFTADERVKRYLAKGKYAALLRELDGFAHTERMGVLDIAEPMTALQVRYIAPILIFEKLAQVRAFDGYLDGATLKMLHTLRIRSKELRYTLEFFAPVLGPSTAEALSTLKRLLTHLGDLNDARIALELIKEVEGDSLMPAVEVYDREKTTELETLVDTFPTLWAEFRGSNWRRSLADAIAIL
jgi:CHAD domain-containing protein